MQENLGKTLRSAREASDISVDDAVYRARMPRSVVEALENDDFGYFASPLYARSFLKQYGDYVGVDVSPWMDDIVPTALIDSDTVEAFFDLPEHDAQPRSRDRNRERETPKPQTGGPMAAVWLILITGGLLWGGVAYFQKLDERLSAPPPEVVDETSATTTEKNETEERDTAAPESPERPIAIAEPETPKRAIIVDLPEE